MKKVLLTGTAGFIGFHLCRRLLSEGYTVVGFDSVNDYYDVNLKRARLKQIAEHEHAERFVQIEADLGDRAAVEQAFADQKPDIVVNLAAQAGVRYSLTNPHVYTHANIAGFLNILEGCRHGNVEHLVFASSSSVYGANKSMPFSIHDNVDHPLSLYAASKKANELMAHSYAHLYNLPVTGLRFFTVYRSLGSPRHGDVLVYESHHRRPAHRCLQSR